MVTSLEGSHALSLAATDSRKMFLDRYIYISTCA